ELIERALDLDYAALAITDECSVAGVVRAHDALKKSAARKKSGFKLIIRAEIRLEDGLKLVLLAANREGYGNLSALITLGRRRAEKGGYRLSREDLDGGMPDCLALLVPGAQPCPEQAHFVARCFPGRAWIAAELLAGPNDRARLRELAALAKGSGLA